MSKTSLSYNGLNLIMPSRDATLITQRLYFANAPHPYKHVLGWYRIMKEMKDCGVSAICVFDGKQRNLAKHLEVREFVMLVI